MRFFFTLFVLLSLCNNAWSQNTPAIRGIINQYASVTAFDSCGRLTVSNATGFTAGSKAIIIQMQGALVNSSTTNAATFGTVTTYGCTGCYEKVEIGHVQGNTIWLRQKLLNNYTTIGLQLVSFPQYTDVLVYDTLRPRPWDGQTGGVVAFEATGTVILNGRISADGAGFRGGVGFLATTNGCNSLINSNGLSYAFAATQWRAARKGEGISLISAGNELGRGAWGNAGGGGNDHNSGGGGGGNTSMGGDGGRNNEPGTFACDGLNPGIGARALTSVPPNRLFAGGGGGAGHKNNDGSTTSGGNGGGIVLVQAGKIEGSNPIISANGSYALTGYGDGAGGGGGGGTIWLSATSAPTTLRVEANGGDGGNTEADTPNRCFGPGGGGGGGRIISSLTGAAAPIGGRAGRVVETTAACKGSSNGGQAGTAGTSVAMGNAFPLLQGTVATVLPIFTQQPKFLSVCAGKSGQFSATLPGNGVTYQWEINIGNGSGWAPITGTNFSGTQTGRLSVNSVPTNLSGAQVRVRARYGTCFDVLSDTASLRVQPSATPSFDPVQQGLNVRFNNTSVNSMGYRWIFGDGTGSTMTNPQHQYTREGTYTVTLKAVSACGDTAELRKTLTIILPPKAAFSVRDTILGCGNAIFTPINQSTGSNATYEWLFTGATPATSTAPTPSVRYTTAGNYTARLIASNAGGRDTLTKPFTVRIFGLPTAAFTYTASAGSNVQFNNQSQNALSYVWLFGDGSQPVVAASPTHRFPRAGSYIVTLVVNNPCGASVLQQRVTVTAFHEPNDGSWQTAQVRVYPNPSSDYFRVACDDCPTPPAVLRLYDWSGRLLVEQKANIDFVTEVNWPAVPTGMYRLEVISGAGERFVRELVKTD